MALRIQSCFEPKSCETEAAERKQQETGLLGAFLRGRLPIRLTKSSAFGLCCAVLCLAAQLCLTLCDPMDCSPPGSSVHGIYQARILECVAMPSSRGSSWPRNQTQVSCIAGRFFIVWVTREAPICRFLNFKRALSALKIGCVWQALCFWATREDHSGTGVRGQTLEG